MKDTAYTVGRVAEIAGVTVRTLHHYDEIGLLTPGARTSSGYRRYDDVDLERLQQILLYRELGVPLQEIGRLLALQGPDRAAILRDHRAWLAERVERSRQLLQTIDRTIAELNGDGTMNDKDLYQGFAPEKQAEYEDWLVDRFGGEMRERIDASKAKLASLGKEGIAARLAEGKAAGVALAEAFHAGAAPEDEANDSLMARHHAWVAAMWGRACPPEAYAGLADLYLEHPDFRANLDRAGAGFTDWLAAAMKAYAARLA